MVDEQTGRVVDKDHKGRGYELLKGKYVEIDEEELDAVKLESTHTIEIDDFVPAEDIDERYLDKPYYIVPNGKAGVDAFVVIRDAMKRKDKVALARVVLSNREHVIALKPLGKGLLGTTLRYPYELRDEDDYFDDIPSPRVSKDMVDLAPLISSTRRLRNSTRTNSRTSMKRRLRPWSSARLPARRSKSRRKRQRKATSSI